jgi:RimJ/RimL family protein N-acetyltransferase
MSPIQPVELPAGDFVLRMPRLTDAEDALAMLADREVRQWHPGPDLLTRQTVRRWLERSAVWSESYIGWVVVEGDRLVGNAYLANISADQRDAWVAYRTAPWARGRGVATAATVAVTLFAFDQLGLERVTLKHAVANAASCRVADKAGFTLEDTERGGFRDSGGKRWDSHVHGLLKPETVVSG